MHARVMGVSREQKRATGRGTTNPDIKRWTTVVAVVYGSLAICGAHLWRNCGCAFRPRERAISEQRGTSDDDSSDSDESFCPFCGPGGNRVEL
jgi:hypothetical protein